MVDLPPAASGGRLAQGDDGHQQHHGHRGLQVASNRCMSGHVSSRRLSKKARKGSIKYVSKSGLRTANRGRSGLTAKADFRGVRAEAGTY